MATIDGPKHIGSLVIDLTDVKDDLVDLPPGGMKGARTEKDGFGDVQKELVAAVPAHGDAAGITASMYQRLLDETVLLEKLRGHEAELSKALEVCTETRTKVENNREDTIGAMAKAVQETARRSRDPGVLAPFEKLVTYNSQIAEKAAQTRRKNAEAKAGDATVPAAEPTPPQ